MRKCMLCERPLRAWQDREKFFLTTHGFMHDVHAGCRRAFESGYLAGRRARLVKRIDHVRQGEPAASERDLH